MVIYSAERPRKSLIYCDVPVKVLSFGTKGSQIGESDSVSNERHGLTEFICEYMDHFALEAKRLHDKAPLIEYNKLIETLRTVVQKLGTLEHPVALATLSQEHKQAAAEAKQAWREIWRAFFAYRRETIALERWHKRSDREIDAQIREIEQRLPSIREDDPEFARALNDALASARDTDAGMAKMSEGWKKIPWLFLRVNLQIYAVYVRYFSSRMRSVVLRHSYIIVVSILIFGVLFAKVTKWVTDSVSDLASTWSWYVGLFIFGGYLFKKYYIDPKVQKHLVKWEAQWLRPVALEIFFARTLALLSRTRARKTSDKIPSSAV
jgi:hypothetical protein